MQISTDNQYMTSFSDDMSDRFLVIAANIITISLNL